MKSVVLVALGGALGSVLRYLVGQLLNRHEPTFVATMFVNIVGCFLFGAIGAALAQRSAQIEWVQPLVLVGFLGGFTTFSAFGWETVRLLETGRHLLAVANIMVQVLVGCLGVLGGILVGQLLIDRI